MNNIWWNIAIYIHLPISPNNIPHIFPIYSPYWRPDMTTWHHPMVTLHPAASSLESVALPGLPQPAEWSERPPWLSPGHWYSNKIWINTAQLVGGCIPTPLKNDGVRQLGWWHKPNISGKIKNWWQPFTTNQYRIIGLYPIIITLLNPIKSTIIKPPTR